MTSTPVHHTAPTPLVRILIVTALASMGTGVFWHGLAFIAKHEYGFSEARNLVLHAVMGSLYVLGATQAGRILRVVAGRMSGRSVLMAIISMQCLACGLPVLVASEFALWVSVAAVTLLSATMWPIVESYLTAGRHGPQMRSAIASFNLTWMPAVTVPMFVMAPILEHEARWSFGLLAAALVVVLLVLPSFQPNPGTHDPDEASQHVNDRYPFLLRSARILLPTSYVLSSVLSPILPYRFEELNVAIEHQTPYTAVWMLARVLAMVILWRLAFWHGRWGTLLTAGVLLVTGFAAVVLASTLTVMIAGFIVLGAGLGMIYYASLYYAMAVGHADVDSGGTHEALIGVGYAAGPMAGLAGLWIGSMVLSPPTAIVVVTWGIVGIAAGPASWPYVRERRIRRQRRDDSS